jgi:hypothetical protein
MTVVKFDLKKPTKINGLKPGLNLPSYGFNAHFRNNLGNKSPFYGDRCQNFVKNKFPFKETNALFFLNNQIDESLIYKKQRQLFHKIIEN